MWDGKEALVRSGLWEFGRYLHCVCTDGSIWKQTIGQEGLCWTVLSECWRAVDKMSKPSAIHPRLITYEFKRVHSPCKTCTKRLPPHRPLPQSPTTAHTPQPKASAPASPVLFHSPLHTPDTPGAISPLGRSPPPSPSDPLWSRTLDRPSCFRTWAARVKTTRRRRSVWVWRRLARTMGGGTRSCLGGWFVGMPREEPSADVFIKQDVKPHATA